MPLLPQPIENKSLEAIRSAEQPQPAVEPDRLSIYAIGLPCDRAVWYTHRHAQAETHAAKSVAPEKARLVAMLRLAGMEVHDRDDRGHPFIAEGLGGHLGSPFDGAVLNVPEAPGTWHVLMLDPIDGFEFYEIAKRGLQQAHNQKYLAAQVLMALTGMRRALYVASSTTDGDLYAERIRYESPAAKSLMERAEWILGMSAPPERIASTAKHRHCQACQFVEMCHGSKPPRPAVPVRVTCRTCVHASPAPDGAWSCAYHKRLITRTEQDRACDHHLFVPDLVTFAQVADAGYGDQGRGWTEYRNADGTTWRNGQEQGCYASHELAKLPGPMVGAGVVDEAKQVLGATVEHVESEVMP